MLLDFSDRTRTGTLNVVWPLPREGPCRLPTDRSQASSCNVKVGPRRLRPTNGCLIRAGGLNRQAGGKAQSPVEHHVPEGKYGTEGKSAQKFRCLPMARVGQ